jgi:hypothetical protein
MKVVALFIVMLSILVNACFQTVFQVSMTTRDVICLGTLTDDDLWFKTTKMQVRPAPTRHGEYGARNCEQDGQEGMAARHQLATASSRRANSGCCPVFSSCLFVVLRFCFLSRKFL